MFVGGYSRTGTRPIHENERERESMCVCVCNRFIWLTCDLAKYSRTTFTYKSRNQENAIINERQVVSSEQNFYEETNIRLIPTK